MVASSHSLFVFISYARANSAIMQRLRADLQTHGVEAWADQEDLHPGTPDWEEALRSAIRASHAVLLIASPHSRSSRYVKDELRIADMYQRPVYPFWVAGDQWMEVIPLGWGSTQYIDGRGSNYDRAVHTVITTLQQCSPPSVSLPEIASTSSPTFESRNPYKGLRAFTSEDAPDFFGRDCLVDKLLQTLKAILLPTQQHEQDARVLVVVGPSGSGKSSVVMAGLLACLKVGRLPGSQDWVYLSPLVPGAHPLESLTLTLAEKLPSRSLKSLRDDLDDEGNRGLHLLACSLSRPPGKRVVLLVDQFEELFTQTTLEAERQHFIDVLVTAMTEPHGPVLVLVTLRADFEDRPMQYLELSQLLEHHRVSVLPMTLKDLRASIEKPAALPDVQLSFDADLVGDLLFDVQGQIGALPLLQFTLDQLFLRRQSDRLTLEAYHAIGGVRGALAQHAEEVYASLATDEHHKLARDLFLRLIDPGMTELDTTRRRAALTELNLPDPQETRILREVMSTFVRERLLTTNTVASVPTVEVSHEALLREWGRLAVWLREAYEDIRLQKAISEDALEWKRRDKPVDRLYRGTQLVEAHTWKERNTPSADEEAFLQAGIDEQEIATDERRRIVEQQTRRYRRRTVLIGLAGLGLAAAAFTLGHSVLQQSFSLIKKLPYSYQGHKNQVFAVAWSPDGKYLASGSIDKTVQVWDAATGVNLLTCTGHTDGVWSVAWSPDGKRLASGSVDKTVQVWDTATGKRLLAYTGHTAAVQNVAWSPDGKHLATASNDKTVQVWDATTGKRLLTYTGHAAAVYGVAWSPDGKHLASGSVDKTMQVWDATTGAHLLTYTGHTDVVICVVWSPDGKRLASGGFDKTVQVWDAATGTHLLTYTGHTDTVQSIAWSPDGKHLASGGIDKTVQVWDALTGNHLFTYTGHTDVVTCVTWSPDGKRLATGSYDKTVQVWSINLGAPLFTFELYGAGNQVVWSPDSKSLASAIGTTENGIVQVWDADTGAVKLSYYASHTDALYSVAWSPDGKHLASGGADKTLQVWDATTGAHVRTYAGHTDEINYVVWSPDGKRLASASNDKTVWVWNAETGAHLLTYAGHTAAVYSVVWSPDGKRLASASNDKTVQVWNAETGAHLLTYTGHTAAVYSVVWSPDGKRLTSGSYDKTVQIWDATTGTHALTYTGHTDHVWDVAWSPNSKHLASVGKDKTVQVWDAATGIHLLTFRGHTNSVESVAWSPDGNLLASSSSDRTVQVRLMVQI